MGADSPEITVGTARGGLYVGLMGRATQRTCPTADRLVEDYLASRPQPPIVVLDLTGCEWVDSTFAGWLVGLSKRISHMANAQMCVAGCGDRCRASLERMGLSDLFQLANVEAGLALQRLQHLDDGVDQPGDQRTDVAIGVHEEGDSVPVQVVAQATVLGKQHLVVRARRELRTGVHAEVLHQ